MRASIIKIVFLNFLVAHATTHCVSIVYNLKIAEATKRQAVEQKIKRPAITALTLFDQERKTYNKTRQSIGGGLLTFIYDHKAFYLRIDGAVAHVSEKNKCIPLHNSRTQTDDILITTGFTHDFNKRTKATLSGLFGIPTHNDTALQGIEFGTGHVGLGVQLDASYVYSQHFRHSIIGAARLIQFFHRHADACILGNARRFDVGLGNLADLFISHVSNWGRHKLEVGYNPTFAFGATIHPSLPVASGQVTFIRNSFYTSYRYGFLIRRIPNAITIGLSYGFDSKPKTIGMKRVITSWLTWGVNF